MAQPLDRSSRLPQLGDLDTETGEFWRENTFEMGRGDDNLSAYEPNRMYLNLNGEKFLDCSFASGCDIDADSRSVAAADFNRDGTPDLLVGSVGGGPLRLFANNFKDAHHSVRLNLVGTKSNRMGIGSRATITVGSRTIVRDLFPANGCLGQAPAELLVGVGTAEQIDRLEVRWPNGILQEYRSLPVDGVLTLTEGVEGFESSSYRNSIIESPTRTSTFVSIDTPSMRSADSSALGPNERVLGLSFRAEHRAYPVRYMQKHHLCHDDVAGTPLLISYCPPSASYAAFERRIIGSEKDLTLKFDVAGMLQSVGYTVLRDRETKSLWNPLTGQCLKGKLRGTHLKRVALFCTDWDQWRTLTESTKILGPELEEYSPVATGSSNSGSKYVTNVRKSCAPDTLGLGVRGLSEQLFFPLEELATFKGSFASGRLRDRKIVIFFDAERSTAQCFYSATSTGPLDVEFSQADSTPGRFVGTDGSVFDMLGHCRSGPQAGVQLEPVASTSLVRWYAWSLTFPKTLVVKKRN